MKTRILILICILNTFTASSRDRLYAKSYGNHRNPAIVYIHGGPGYNSVSFEATAAQTLSENGYYVIVYDQRGCGRSKHTRGAYTFKESVEDLNWVYDKFRLKSATIIGHSFGGTIGIMFAKAHPTKVDNLILVGSPVSYQMTFKSIIEACKNIYAEKDTTQLLAIQTLEKSDTLSRDYCNSSLSHAMSCGLYTPKEPTARYKSLTDSLKATPDAKYLNDITRSAFDGYYRNENYSTLDLTKDLKEIKKQTYVYAIYGDEDVLFDYPHLQKTMDVVGRCNLHMINKASHAVFLDQPEVFLDIIKKLAR